MKKSLPLFLLSVLFSCTNDTSVIIPDTGYPADVENILVKKCATEGCHNTASRYTAAGLDFSSWDIMFEGGRNGSSVIPYSVDYSYMLYTVNTDSTRGPVLSPTMPYQRQHLSSAEYQVLVNWIANGAPDKNGFVKFSDDPTRKKIYICMQGCDKVAVMDAQTKNIMRYVDVGSVPGITEAPHQVRVSPDGNYWYVVFIAGNVLQKFRTSDDVMVSELVLDNQTHNWNTIIFTPDGKTGFISALDGRTQIVNLDNMTLITFLTHTTPHGGFTSHDGRYLYLTCQNGNFFYKIDLTSAPFYDQEEQIVLSPGDPVSFSSVYQPHEMFQTPDGSKYFVSCQGNSEVRAFQASNDSLLAVIPVGKFPQEFDVSEKRGYLFVTCTEQIISPTKHGSVYIIDYNNLTVVNSIYTGFQPHGLAVDDEENLVYVANLNYDPNAPAPHHVTKCGGRNGYITIIDLNTPVLQLYSKTLADGNAFQYKNEVLPFPYFVSLRK